MKKMLMKKNIALLFLCVILLGLCSCTFDKTAVNAKIEYPVFADFELSKVVQLNSEEILLCYYKNFSPTPNRQESKLVYYNLADKTYSDVYNGELSHNFFYDVAFDVIDGGLNIYRKSDNSFFIKYDMTNNTAEKIALNYEGDFAVNISDNAYLVSDDGLIKICDMNNNEQIFAYDIDSKAVDHKLDTDSRRFITVDNNGRIVLFDYQNKSAQEIICTNSPSDTVGYTAVNTTAGDNLVVAVLCEDSDVLQIIDSTTGEVIAMHSSGVCELADVADDELLLIENNNAGRKNSQIVKWNYTDNSTTVLFELTEQYKDAYITDACFSDNMNKIIFIITEDGVEKLLEQDIIDAN